MSSYKSVDALQNALANTVFKNTGAPKKAAGRALGSIVELITFYMIREWDLERGLAIERGLPEYGNGLIRHNVEFSLHASTDIGPVPIANPEKSLTRRQIELSLDGVHKNIPKEYYKTGPALLSRGLLRHANTFAVDGLGFWISYMEGNSNEFNVSRLTERPFAMFECKRVGIEEGQKKGPQTIEKAKQGAYVARTVSGLQRIALRDGGVAALVEELDGSLTTHRDYYAFLQDAITARNAKALANIVLTVGVVSNHGNWFTSGTQNKEMRVLAQSYDWLLFLTDDALAEFIEDVLQGTRDEFGATRDAFTATFGRSSGGTRFTKIQIEDGADAELTSYFRDTQPWEKWFNVIAPEGRGISELRRELHQLQSINDENWSLK